MRKVIQFIKDVKWVMGGSITRYKLLYILLRFKELFLVCLLLACLSGCKGSQAVQPTRTTIYPTPPPYACVYANKSEQCDTDY